MAGQELERELNKIAGPTWEATVPGGPQVYGSDRVAVLEEALRNAPSDAQITYRQIGGSADEIPEIVTPFLE